MKKKFDTSKPHEHQCPKCHAPVHCRAAECEYPEWTECTDCVEGWKYQQVEGEIVKVKEIPRRHGVDRMFP